MSASADTKQRLKRGLRESGRFRRQGPHQEGSRCPGVRDRVRVASVGGKGGSGP